MLILIIREAYQMVTAKDVVDSMNTVVKTAADFAGTAGQTAEGAAKTVTQFHSWATNEVSRKVAASACDSLEIAVEEVRSRSLSRHPVTITTTISLGPAEVVMSVQLEPTELVVAVEQK
jgi:hypothetical protein